MVSYSVAEDALSEDEGSVVEPGMTCTKPGNFSSSNELLRLHQQLTS